MSEVGKTYDHQEPKTTSGTFFCRIRAYNGLKHGFTIKERKTRYCPFKLVVCFSEVDKDASISSTKSPFGHQIIYMFITAIPITTAYTESFQEGPIKLNTGQNEFVSKHTSQGKFSWFDECAISYTGHLPQNIIGADIFEYFHPADLVIIKEAFDVVMAEPGKPCKSKPFRFRINNGGYITISSWWSSFINPWSKQLEFIHGKHMVTQGPKITDIFNSREGSIEEIKDPCSQIKEEIRRILSKTLVPSKVVPQNPVTQTSKNKKELASFMGSLLEEVAKAESYKIGQSSKALVMGNISPHYSDSSESPPSYNQLTYNENLTRFFNSQPKTLSEKDIMSNLVYSSPSSYEDNPKEAFKPQSKSKKEQRKSKSGEAGEEGSRGSGDKHSGQGSGEQPGSGTGKTVSGSGENEAKNSSSLQIGLSAGHIPQGAEESIMSQDGCTSGSGSRLGSGSREGVDEYKPPVLTEDLLVLHNREMEKQMVTKFKKAKRIGELGFLKEGKKIDQSESKKVMVSKNKAKNEVTSGTTMRQPLSQPMSTILEVPTKSVSHSAR